MNKTIENYKVFRHDVAPENAGVIGPIYHSPIAIDVSINKVRSLLNTIYLYIIMKQSTICMH